MKREPAVAKEMSKLDTDKKMSRKEKDERILWKKNEVIKLISFDKGSSINDVTALGGRGYHGLCDDST